MEIFRLFSLFVNQRLIYDPNNYSLWTFTDSLKAAVEGRTEQRFLKSSRQSSTVCQDKASPRSLASRGNQIIGMHFHMYSALENAFELGYFLLGILLKQVLFLVLDLGEGGGHQGEVNFPCNISPPALETVLRTMNEKCLAFHLPLLSVFKIRRKK